MRINCNSFVNDMLAPAFCIIFVITIFSSFTDFSNSLAQENELAGMFYVSASGSDSNDGLSIDSPFATPEKARDLIRLRRAEGSTGRFVVYLSGVFSRSEPFVLDARDSDVEYLGVDDACFSGGVALKAWRIASNEEKSGFPEADSEIWVSDLPELDGNALFFEQLFVGDRRAVRARFPNEGFLRPESVWEEFPTNPQNNASAKPTTAQELRARKGDLDILNLSSATPEELRFSQFVVHHHWDTTRRIILGYDPNSRALSAKGAPMKFWNPWRDSSLYYLENLRGAFDVAGEWFYDGVNKRAYYRPLPGETLENTSFVAPRPGLNQLLTINGSSNGEKTRNVRFENVKFSYTDAPRRFTDMKTADIPETITGDLHKPGPSQFEPAQAAFFTVAVLEINNANNVVLEKCDVSHTGEYGLWFKDCEDCCVRQSCFTDLGAGAVRIGGGKMDRGNCVENCVLSQGGRFFASATGVWIGQNTEENAILHCDITDFYYTGVSVGWVWGYSGGHAFRNRIEFNRISKIGQGATSDMGGVYTLGTSIGTRICNNVIFDVSSYAYGGWGLYPDEGSEGILFENNLVYDTTDGSFHQHYGKDNVVRNNILARSRSNPANADKPAHQIAITRVEDHLSTTFERNIIYWKEGVALGYNADSAKAIYTCNLWFDAGGIALFNDKTHEQWSKETGKDVDGRVADPLFVNPDANDFRLKPDSPALEMGFVPFDYTRAGANKE